MGLLAAVFAATLLAGRAAESGWPRADGAALGATVTFPADRTGRAEPLLSVGRGGDGDVVFVYYHSSAHISFGWEQPGWGVLYSDPLAIDPGRSHRLLIALGSLMPPAGAPIYAAHPEWNALRGLALVQLDGRTVLAAHGSFGPSALNQAAVGRNVVGGAVAGAFFTGRITDPTPMDPVAVLAAGRQVTSFVGPGSTGTSSDEKPAGGAGGYPGPLRIRLRFPRGMAGTSEPLLVTGRTGAGDIVFVRYDSDTRLHFGFDHWLKGGPVSAAVEIDPDRTQEILLSLGSLLPPSAGSGPDPFAALRKRCLLYLNGRLVLDAASDFYPTPPAAILIAANPIGGSTAGPAFSGVIIHTEAVPPDQFPVPAP